MENAIETVKRGGFTAHIYYDTDSLVLVKIVIIWVKSLAGDLPPM